MIIQAHHKNINALATEVDTLSESRVKLAEDHNDLIQRYNELLSIVKDFLKSNSEFIDNYKLTLVLAMDSEQRLAEVENFLADSYNYDIGKKEDRFRSLLQEFGINKVPNEA